MPFENHGGGIASIISSLYPTQFCSLHFGVENNQHTMAGKFFQNIIDDYLEERKKNKKFQSAKIINLSSMLSIAYLNAITKLLDEHFIVMTISNTNHGKHFDNEYIKKDLNPFMESLNEEQRKKIIFVGAVTRHENESYQSCNSQYIENKNQENSYVFDNLIFAEANCPALYKDKTGQYNTRKHGTTSFAAPYVSACLAVLTDKEESVEKAVEKLFKIAKQQEIKVKEPTIDHGIIEKTINLKVIDFNEILESTK